MSKRQIKPIQNRYIPTNGRPDNLKTAYRKRAGLDTIIAECEKKLLANVWRTTNKYDGDVLAKAMSIVWWDHVSDFPEGAKDTFCMITAIKETYKLGSEPPFSDVCECLECMGYSAGDADMRARVEPEPFESETEVKKP